MKEASWRKTVGLASIIFILVFLLESYGFHSFSRPKLASPYLSLQTIKPFSTSRALTIDSSLLRSLGVSFPLKRFGKVPLFKLPFQKTLTALQKLALIFRQFFQWIRSLFSGDKPIRESKNVRRKVAPSTSILTASSTVMNDRRSSFNRLDKVLSGAPPISLMNVPDRRKKTNVQPLFDENEVVNYDPNDAEILIPSSNNGIHIEANMSRLLMSKEQQARLYVEERLREIEFMRENRRSALNGEHPSSRTSSSDNSKKMPFRPVDIRSAVERRSEYNPPPSMQFSAQRTSNKRSYWPPLNNKPSAMMMNQNMTSSKSKLDQYGHYVNEPSSASLTIDNATPMLSELPSLHDHHHSSENNIISTVSDSTVSSALSNNTTASNSINSAVISEAAINNVTQTVNSSTPATIAPTATTTLARISSNGSSSGDVIADLFASIKVTSDDKVHYPRFVGRWRLLEQRFLNASNIDTKLISKNIKPAVVTTNPIVEAAVVVAVDNSTVTPDDAEQAKLINSPTTTPKVTAVEPLFLSTIQEDLITIPSYGRVISSMNGSSGFEDWRCYSVTDEHNATRVLLSFGILRGCSDAFWSGIGTQVKAEVIRPPKGAFDQLPKTLLYRGEILGNRVLGHVYKKDELQPIGTFQLLRVDNYL